MQSNIPPSSPNPARPRVLAGWRIGVFAYLLLGGFLMALPTVMNFGLIASLDTNVRSQGIVSWVLFGIGVALLLSSIFLMSEMATNKPSAIRWAKLFCVGKVVYSSLILFAARFVFRGWAFLA